MVCPKCGKKLSDTSTFCSGCGWKSEAWTEEVKKTEKANNTRLAVVIACSVILALLGIAFINVLMEVL